MRGALIDKRRRKSFQRMAADGSSRHDSPWNEKGREDAAFPG
jgi:hypothetical protein